MGQVLERATTFTTPNLDEQSSTAELVLGIINCIFFGVGTIVAGIMNGDLTDIIIGVLQLCIPFVGWVWSVIWGVKMIINGLERGK